jgi:hypothetical protein
MSACAQDIKPLSQVAGPTVGVPAQSRMAPQITQAGPVVVLYDSQHIVSITFGSIRKWPGS